MLQSQGYLCFIIKASSKSFKMHRAPRRVPRLNCLLVPSESLKQPLLREKSCCDLTDIPKKVMTSYCKVYNWSFMWRVMNMFVSLTNNGDREVFKYHNFLIKNIFLCKRQTRTKEIVQHLSKTTLYYHFCRGRSSSKHAHAKQLLCSLCILTCVGYSSSH